MSCYMEARSRRQAPGKNKIMKANSNRVSGLWTVVVLSLAALLGACGILPGKSSLQPLRTYTLSASPAQGQIEAGALEGASCINGQVFLPRSAPGFNTARMAYLRSPERIDYFAFSQWVDTPAYMLQPLLVEALARSGRFKHVVLAPSSIGSRFRLESDDLTLVQQFDGGVNRVRLALRVRLVDSAASRYLFDEAIVLERAAQGADPASGVAMANELTRELMEKVTAASQAAIDLSEFCSP